MIGADVKDHRSGRDDQHGFDVRLHLGVTDRHKEGNGYKVGPTAGRI